MDALSILEGHFARMQRRPFTVPNVDAAGEPWVVYLDPITPEQATAYDSRTKGKGDAEQAIIAAIMFAKDADGNPVFADKAETVVRLRKTPLAPLQQIAVAALTYTKPVDLGN